MADYIHPDERYEDEIASSSRATNQKPKPSSSLALPGFRSVNPLVGIGAGGIIALVVISVLWSLIAHPVTSFAATTPSATLPPTNTTQETVDPQAVDPDPTSPPTSPAYLTHRTNAQQPVSLSTESTTSVAMQSAGPSGESPEEIAAADNARRVEEASYASSRMSFNSQNEQDGSSTLASSDTSQNYPIQTTATAPRNASIAMTSENDATTSGQHGAFVAAHDGNPGYETPTSPYELVKGTIIPARLITAIDSTVPGGLVKAEIIESIFDSRTHSVVVLPQGTVVLGYADSAQYGEARLVVDWTEFYIDGRKFFAASNEGAGSKGESGMSASVDTHAGRAFGSALVGAVLQAGTNLAARATTIDISSASTIVQPQRPAPTLHAYPGQLFNIVLNHDLPLDRYNAGAP